MSLQGCELETMVGGITAKYFDSRCLDKSPRQPSRKLAVPYASPIGVRYPGHLVAKRKQA